MTGVEVLAIAAVASTAVSAVTSIAGAQQQAAGARYEAEVQAQQAEFQRQQLDFDKRQLELERRQRELEAEGIERERAFAERDATVLEREAGAIEERAAVQEAQFRKDVARLRARQIANAVGSGMTLEGSPLTIIGADAADAEYEIQLLHYDAGREAGRLRDEATLRRADAETLAWNANALRGSTRQGFDVARGRIESAQDNLTRSQTSFREAGEIRARTSLIQGYSQAASSIGSLAMSSGGSRGIPRLG